MEIAKTIRIPKEVGIGYFAYGNTNIIRNHIIFFEILAEEEIIKISDLFKNKIEKDENSSKRSFVEYPFFGVWLRLNVEYIINKLFYDYSRISGESIPKRISKWGPTEYIKETCALLREVNKSGDLQIDSYYVAINIVRIFGDCIRHGGIPNISKRIKKHPREMIKKILDPMNFEQTKQLFKDAVKFSDLLPKTTLII